MERVNVIFSLILMVCASTYGRVLSGRHITSFDMSEAYSALYYAYSAFCPEQALVCFLN